MAILQGVIFCVKSIIHENTSYHFDECKVIDTLEIHVGVSQCPPEKARIQRKGLSWVRGDQSWLKFVCSLSGGRNYGGCQIDEFASHPHIR